MPIDNSDRINTMFSAHHTAERRNDSEMRLERVRGEYLEMPGLSLTLVQAQRLWGIDRDECRLLLDGLVRTGFLRKIGQGEYVRART
jgi:hypothetical protein